MNKTLKLSLVATALVTAGTLLPDTAHAKKPGVLEGKPIVVERIELRKLRFSVTPLVGMSLSQPYVHKGFAGATLRFDITDWIGVKVGGAYGVLNVDAKLLKAINDGGLPAGQAVMGRAEPIRPNSEIDNPAPLRHDFRAGLTALQWQGSADLAFTPFAGKLGIFQSIFTEYDIYIFGGVGLTGWKKYYPDELSTAEILNLDTSDPKSDTYCRETSGANNAECLLHPVKAEEGVKVGGSFGAGLHLFVSDWLSINPEIHDIVVGHNIAGLNATIPDVPPRVDNDDRVAVHNVTFNLGVTFYLPPRAKRSTIKPPARDTPAGGAAAAGVEVGGGVTAPEGGPTPPEGAPPAGPEGPPTEDGEGEGEGEGELELGD
jgi:outer membrane beta-barrel protein